MRKSLLALLFCGIALQLIGRSLDGSYDAKINFMFAAILSYLLGALIMLYDAACKYAATKGYAGYIAAVGGLAIVGSFAYTPVMAEIELREVCATRNAGVHIYRTTPVKGYALVQSWLIEKELATQLLDEGYQFIEVLSSPSEPGSRKFFRYSRDKGGNIKIAENSALTARFLVSSETEYLEHGTTVETDRIYDRQLKQVVGERIEAYHRKFHDRIRVDSMRRRTCAVEQSPGYVSKFQKFMKDAIPPG